MKRRRGMRGSSGVTFFRDDLGGVGASAESTSIESCLELGDEFSSGPIGRAWCRRCFFLSFESDLNQADGLLGDRAPVRSGHLLQLGVEGAGFS